MNELKKIKLIDGSIYPLLTNDDEIKQHWKNSLENPSDINLKNVKIKILELDVIPINLIKELVKKTEKYKLHLNFGEDNFSSIELLTYYLTTIIKNSISDEYYIFNTELQTNIEKNVKLNISMFKIFISNLKILFDEKYKELNYNNSMSVLKQLKCLNEVVKYFLEVIKILEKNNINYSLYYSDIVFKPNIGAKAKEFKTDKIKIISLMKKSIKAYKFLINLENNYTLFQS